MRKLDNTKLTRLVCTLPDDILLYDEDTMKNLIMNGMDIARVKLIDVNQEDYHQIINMIQNTAAEQSEIVGIMLDIPSPDRLLKINEKDEIPVYIDQQMCFYHKRLDNEATNPLWSQNQFFLTDFGDDIVPGVILIVGEDVTGEVIEVTQDYIRVQFHNDATIINGSRVYINGQCRMVSNMTDYQREALVFCASSNADYVSFPFSDDENFEEELVYIRNLFQNKNIKVLCRIENLIEKDRLINVIEKTDGIVIGRAPMGGVMPIEQTCTFQKKVVNYCRYKARPVFISGHVLGSLRSLPYPLRADAFDLYNGVMDGVDGFVLSQELMKEEIWLNNMRITTELLKSAEKDLNFKEIFKHIWIKSNCSGISEAIASSAVKTSIELNSKFIICIIKEGTLPRHIAKYQPSVPIITIGSSLRKLQSNLLHRGVLPILGEISDYKRTVQNVQKMLQGTEGTIVMTSEERLKDGLMRDHLGVIELGIV